MAIVLLAEADAGARDGICAILRSAGHYVQTVDSAARARELAGDHDFAVLGGTLPDGSGFDVLDDLAGPKHAGHNPKAVVLIPKGEPEAEQLLVELRDDAYFCEPFSRARLLQLVAQSANPAPVRKNVRIWAALPPWRGKLRA